MANDFADFLKIVMDENLTVRNASEQGYRHVLDIDRDTLADLQKDIYCLVQKEGYRVGQPRYIWPEKGKEQDRGLYEPLQKPQGENQSKN